MDRHRVETIHGTGSFLDANTVLVTRADGSTHALTASKILIATGTRPHHPPDYPWHDPRLLESDTILNITQLPKKMLVLGGGVIGSEYACIFAALGVKVMLVDGRERLLGFLDAELSTALQNAMRSMGIDLRLGDKVESLTSGEKLQPS